MPRTYKTLGHPEGSPSVITGITNQRPTRCHHYLSSSTVSGKFGDNCAPPENTDITKRAPLNAHSNFCNSQLLTDFLLLWTTFPVRQGGPCLGEIDVLLFEIEAIEGSLEALCG